MRPDRRTAGVAVAGCVSFLNLYTPQAILPEIARDLAVSVASTGLAITAPLLAVAGVAPFVGTISDRLGRWRLIVGAAFAMVVPTLLVAAAPDLHALVLWRFVQGLLLPFVFTVCVAYIGDECPGAASVRAAGAYSIGAIVGGFSGRIVAGTVAEFAGWRMGFVAVAVLSLTGAAFIAAVLPREQRFVRLRGGMGAALGAYRLHVQSARLVATCTVGFGMLFTNVAAYTYVNFYLAAPPFNLTPAQLGLVFTVYLLGIVTTTAATWLAVRIGRRATLALATGLAACGLLLTLVSHVAAVIGGLALMSGGLFVLQALSLGFIAAATRHAKSTAVGLYVSVYYIGGALGGVLPGGVWSHAGWPGVVALLVTVLVATSAAGLVFWREPGRG